MDKEVKEFCHRYDAQVQPSTKMYHRARRIDYRVWSESDQETYQNCPIDRINCVEVHMPEDQFRALIENKRWLDEFEDYNRGRRPQIHSVQKIIAQHEDETRLRHQHPGVMDAWQQYQTMLQLVR